MMHLCVVRESSFAVRLLAILHFPWNISPVAKVSPTDLQRQDLLSWSVVVFRAFLWRMTLGERLLFSAEDLLLYLLQTPLFLLLPSRFGIRTSGMDRRCPMKSQKLSKP
jgi:hypothetical protein